jgi:hypothetical protein
VGVSPSDYHFFFSRSLARTPRRRPPRRTRFETEAEHIPRAHSPLTHTHTLQMHAHRGARPYPSFILHTWDGISLSGRMPLSSETRTARWRPAAAPPAGRSSDGLLNSPRPGTREPGLAVLASFAKCLVVPEAADKQRPEMPGAGHILLHGERKVEEGGGDEARARAGEGGGREPKADPVFLELQKHPRRRWQ